MNFYIPNIRFRDEISFNQSSQSLNLSVINEWAPSDYVLPFEKLNSSANSSNDNSHRIINPTLQGDEHSVNEPYNQSIGNYLRRFHIIIFVVDIYLLI